MGNLSRSKRVKKTKKAQSSIEYGAFFAFSLMIGLVIVTIITELNTFGVEGRISESEGYWYAKKPLAISDFVYFSNGSVTFVVYNKDIQPLRIINISTDKGTIDINKTVSPSEAIPVSGDGFPTCNADDLEEMELKDVSITYSRPGDSGTFVISGSVPLRGYCVYAEKSESSSGGGGCAGGTILYTLILLYYLRMSFS